MKTLRTYQLITFTALFFCSFQGWSQTDTINFSDHKLLTGQLKTGLRQYLVYFHHPARARMLNLSLWAREVKRSEHQGEKRLEIIQTWYGNDTSAYRTIHSINRAADFAPIYHAETIRNQLNAYNWSARQVKGAEEAGNTKNTFLLPLDQPCFNWNLDIETFEMLPLAAGKQFVLHLYDAGSVPPADITFKVIGDGVLKTLDNRQVDCWKLLNEGDHGQIHYTQTYWISKKGHEFLMEEDSYNGTYRYKVKLPAGAPVLSGQVR